MWVVGMLLSTIFAPNRWQQLMIHRNVMGVCNFLGSISSQQKFEAMDVKALGQTVSQHLVTAQFYLENKRKIHPRGVKACWPKRREEKRAREPGRERASERASERARERPLALWLLFICFFLLPLGLPCVDWASRSAVCSTWGPHSGPRTFLCSIFMDFSLPCLLATAILGSFFLF